MGKIIEVNITEQEIQELQDGKEFVWEFEGLTLKIFKGEEK